jgi:ribonucleotide monophosphatase NagD (HAD superfamily)
VRNGARFIATNRDVTYPSPTGLKPGAGSIVAAVEAASGVVPVNAGKPEPIMRKLLGEMLVHGPVVLIGDRPDTDLAMADAEGWVSVLVDTGVTRPDEAVHPAPTHRLASITSVPGLIG